MGKSKFSGKLGRSRVSGPTTTIIEGENSQLDVVINTLGAWFLGLDLGPTDIGSAEARLFGFGGGFKSSYDPKTNVGTVAVSVSALLGAEGDLSLDFDDFSISSSYNGFATLSSRLGVGQCLRTLPRSTSNCLRCPD